MEATSEKFRCRMLIVGKFLTLSRSTQVHRPAPSNHPHYRPWVSSDPECLRAQLLFLLRKAPVSFRTWDNEQSAPGSRLPALHLLNEEKLIPSDQVRAWLDRKYPLKGKNKE